MKNKIIFTFIIILTLFITISAISADENVTDVVNQDEGDEVVSLDISAEELDGVNSAPQASEIKAKDKVSYHNYEDTFDVALSSNKAPLANKQVKIIINNVVYNKKTNSKGIASVDFKLKAGKYPVKFSFAGDKDYASSNGAATLLVKSGTVTQIKVADKYITYREGLRSIFQLELTDAKDKAISGKYVYIKYNGKTYKAKTNSKGLATFYLSPKKGTLKIPFFFSKSGKYLPSKGTCKINVKSKLTKGDGYWVNKWDMNNVDLKKLYKLGTKHILLSHAAFEKYGESKVLKWINKAHKYGMKVHMWMAVFYKDGKYYPPSDKNGKFNYKQMKKILKQAKHYASLKGVDGIHFDYLRFAGNAHKYKNSAEAVNYFAKQASIVLNKVNPDIIISAALMPEPNDMKKYYGQEVPVLSKYMDVIIPMVYKGNYYASTNWIKKTTNAFVKQTNGAQIWTGLQSYKSDWDITKLSYNALFKDAQAAKKGGASGVIMFRWGLSALLNFKKL